MPCPGGASSGSSSSKDAVIDKHLQFPPVQGTLRIRSAPDLDQSCGYTTKDQEDLNKWSFFMWLLRPPFQGKFCAALLEA